MIWPENLDQFMADVDAGKNFGPTTPQQQIDMIDQMRDEIPESMLVHLTEREVIEEYIHHYGKP